VAKYDDPPLTGRQPQQSQLLEELLHGGRSKQCAGSRQVT